MNTHVPPTTSHDLIARLLASFPELEELGEEHRGALLGSLQFNRLRGGDIAYRQGQHCHAYVMCLEGQTRVFKTSESGREILLYQVGPGETCVLTTSCLMAGSPFPAESTAETDVLHAALPASALPRQRPASLRSRKIGWPSVFMEWNRSLASRRARAIRRTSCPRVRPPIRVLPVR